MNVAFKAPTPFLKFWVHLLLLADHPPNFHSSPLFSHSNHDLFDFLKEFSSNASSSLEISAPNSTFYCSSISLGIRDTSYLPCSQLVQNSYSQV
jgi:hypothetical protein